MHADHGVEAFCDALWLEDGLSLATRLAYRRDLNAFARSRHWQLPQHLQTVLRSEPKGL
ncbi:MAG: hypothetical protein EBW71_07420, partial [Betaproteobacteria bacterium]|nr:hypothetical protein [Betaproteobacteria bacterium]